MSPQQERDWIDEASDMVRSMSVEALVGTFDSVVVQCAFITQVGGDVSEVGHEAAIEFALLRAEMEVRGLIRFH